MSGLSGRRWERVRRAVLERDGYACQNCRKWAGRMEVDHIKPRHAGGAVYDPANCQTLCVDCHLAKSRQEFRQVSPEKKAWEDLIAAML